MNTVNKQIFHFITVSQTFRQFAHQSTFTLYIQHIKASTPYLRSMKYIPQYTYWQLPHGNTLSEILATAHSFTRIATGLTPPMNKSLFHSVSFSVAHSSAVDLTGSAVVDEPRARLSIVPSRSIDYGCGPRGGRPIEGLSVGRMTTLHVVVLVIEKFQYNHYHVVKLFLQLSIMRNFTLFQ